ncbi:MAG: beta strand repeat-containing protein, partial [Planctomycetota bacterium]
RTLTVNKAVLTVRADDKLKDANGTVFSPFTSTISGYVNSDPTSVVTGTVTYSGTAATATAIGNYVITPVVTGLSATNYTFSAVSGTLNLNNPAAATPTITWATPTAITYGTALSATQLNATSGGVAGTFSYSPAIGAILPAGTQGLLVTFTPTDGNNYKSTFKVITITVNKNTLTFTATAQAKTYDGAAYSGSYSYTVSGYVNGDNSTAFSGTTTYAGAAITATNAGSYAITPVVSGITSANYVIAAANGTLTINKATLTVSPNPKTKTYTGVVTTDFSSSITGYVNGDTVAVVSGSVAYTGTGATAINVGTGYVVTPDVSGLTASNYSFVAGAASTLSINKAVLTVTPNAITKTYDGKTAFESTLALNGTASYLQLPVNTGLNFGTGDVTFETRVKMNSTQTINFPRFFGNRNGTTGPFCFNYVVNTKQLNCIINGTTAYWDYDLLDNAWHHVAMSRSAGNWTVYVDGIALKTTTGLSTISSTGSLTSTVGWRVGADFQGEVNTYLKGEFDEVRFWNVARSAADIAANKNSQVATSSTGLVAYYQFNEGAGTSAASSASTTGLTGTLTGAGATWAGTSPTHSITGFVNGETSSVVTAGTVTYSGTGMTAINAGSYTLTPAISGYSATNYSFVTANGTMTINKATLTVTPDAKSKTYDGQGFTTFTSTITGYVNGDTSSVITGTATYSGAATTATSAGTYASITSVVSGMSATNYTFASATGTLTINKVTLTVTSDAKSKTYDGLAFTAFTSNITGYVNSETSSVVSGSVTYSGAATTATAAGTYASITAVVSGLSATNYSFVAGTVGTLTIGKATLTVTPDAKSKTYNGTTFTGFTSTITGYVNSETSSVITGSATYSGAATSAINAGTYASITAVVSGMSATNYTIVAGTAGTLTISKAALTLTAADKSKTYTGTVFSGYTYAYAGFVNSETVAAITPGTVTYSGTAIAATAAGSYVITPAVSGFAATNYSAPTLVNGTLTINKAVLTVTPNSVVKTYNATTMGGSATSALKNSTVSIVTGSGFVAPYGMANDGSQLYVSDGSTIKTVSFSGSVIATNTVSNLGRDFNTMCYTKGYLFARNGSSLYRISTSTWTSTLVTVDSSNPLPNGSYWTSYNIFDTPNGQIGVLGAAPNPVVKFYDVSSDGLTLTYSSSVTLNDSWTPKEQGVASDGTYLYRLGGVSSVIGEGYKVYNLATGNVAYDGTYAATGWALQTADKGGTLSNPVFINRNHISGRYYVADWNSNKFMVSDPTVGFDSTVTGYASGENASVITGSFNYSGDAITATNAGTYTISSIVSGLSASNYTFQAANGTLTINKATLTVTADNKTRTYTGGTFTAFTSAISGYVNSESVANITAGTVTYSGTATTATDAGTSTITPVLSGFAADNYSFVVANGTLTTNKATLTVTPDAKSKTYDGTAFTGFSSTITGYVNSETSSVSSGSATYSGAATTATNAGTYASIT